MVYTVINVIYDSFAKSLACDPELVSGSPFPDSVRS